MNSEIERNLGLPCVSLRGCNGTGQCGDEWAIEGIGQYFGSWNSVESGTVLKIEIGESLGYSYLRHVKRCWLVQTNRKVSADWCTCMSEQDMERDFLAMRERFDSDGQVFKGTADAGQFLRQAEIDVVGLDQDGGIHAMGIVDPRAGGSIIRLCLG